MYHTKKIGVFISHIMGYYQKNVCQGIIDKALEYGYTAEIFTTMDGENLGEYGIGEESILHIPNYANYDGIIFASETYPMTDLKNQILEALQKECTCPVVEIAVSNQHFPAVALENCSMVSDLTRHLVSVHHYNRICFLGCSSERYFSDSRENYYRNTMQELKKNVTPNDVFCCDYDSTQIADALAFFLESEQKPDAVICYNDRMALLFMMAAKNAGFKIPQDIAITGCDCTEDGAHVTPALTSVTFPVYELGVSAVEKLLLLMQKETVPAVTNITAAPFFSASCGCPTQTVTDPLFFQHRLNERIGSLEDSILTSMRMSAAFQRISDLDEGMNLLENYVHIIDGCKEFYLCLYSDWNVVSDQIQGLTHFVDDADMHSDEIILKLAIRDQKRLPECSFRKTPDHSLLPAHIYQASNSAYIYTPLFFEDKEFGYIALSYKDNHIDYHFQLVHWFMDINQMLQSICEAKCTSLLIHQLEDIYTKDSLTNLYNKSGFIQYATPLLNQAANENLAVTCFHFHIDNLDKINTSFGHAEGDFALRVTGHALSACMQPADICARFSGNDFYLISSTYTQAAAEELIPRIQKYLTNYQHLSNKDYTISIHGTYSYATALEHDTDKALEFLLTACGNIKDA